MSYRTTHQPRNSQVGPRLTPHWSSQSPQNTQHRSHRSQHHHLGHHHFDPVLPHLSRWYSRQDKTAYVDLMRASSSNLSQRPLHCPTLFRHNGVTRNKKAMELIHHSVCSRNFPCMLQAIFPVMLVSTLLHFWMHADGKQESLHTMNR